jgi:hypothetical protein
MDQVDYVDQVLVCSDPSDAVCHAVCDEIQHAVCDDTIWSPICRQSLNILHFLSLLRSPPHSFAAPTGSMIS